MSGSSAIPSSLQAPTKVPLTDSTLQNSAPTKEGIKTTVQEVLASGQGLSHSSSESLNKREVTQMGSPLSVEKEEKKEGVEKKDPHASRPFDKKEEGGVPMKLPSGISEKMWLDLVPKSKVREKKEEQELWGENLKLAIMVSSQNRRLKEKELKYNNSNGDVFTIFYSFFKYLQERFEKKEIKTANALKERLLEGVRSFMGSLSGSESDLANEYMDIIHKFCESLNDTASELEINLHLEISMNRILNRKFLIVEAEANVEKDKLEIAREIGQWKEIVSAHILVTREIIKDTVSETHNGGKQVLAFMIKNTQNAACFKVIYKPRKSFIDAEVIELFKKINHALSEEPKLFIYTIINFKDKEISYWQYVDGVKSPNETFGKSFFENIIMFKKIIGITRSIGIGDIFENDSNWIWKPSEKGSKPKPNANDIVVPIDLEAMEKPVQEKIDSRISGLVSEFNTHVYERPFRVNPGTKFLVGFQSAVNSASLDSYVTVGKIFDSLEQKGYKITVDKNQLGFMLLLDFINGDIPYFSDMNKKLYWGLSSSGTIIGEINKKES